MKEEQKDFIIGRHPAMAALKKKDSNINKVFVQEGLKADAIQEIYTLAKARKLVVSRVPKTKLDNLVNGQNHQGVVIAIASYSYATIDDLFEKARSKNEDPFFLILDGIEDPHNLGSIMRTADAAGVHGIIIPKRRAVQLTSVVAKTSTGAIEHVPVVRVTNLVQTVKELKEQNKSAEIKAQKEYEEAVELGDKMKVKFSTNYIFAKHSGEKTKYMPSSAKIDKTATNLPYFQGVISACASS